MELVVVDNKGGVHLVRKDIEDARLGVGNDGETILYVVGEVIQMIEKEANVEMLMKCLSPINRRGFWLSPDGHTIFASSYYTDRGMSEEFVKRYVRTHVSGEGKKGITTDEGPVSELEGVHNLHILRGIGRTLNLYMTNKFRLGRGSEAKEWYRLIEEELLNRIETSF